VDSEVRGSREFLGWGQGLSKLLVPSTPANQVAYLTLILMIIGMILDAKNDGRTVKVEEVNQVINNITVEAPTPSAPPALVPSGPVNQSPEQVEAGRRVSRNQQCPCGSDLKFEKCRGSGGDPVRQTLDQYQFKRGVSSCQPDSNSSLPSRFSPLYFSHEARRCREAVRSQRPG
jgi:hypothetical protein